MRVKGVKGVGRFAIDFEVANYEDMAAARRELLEPKRVRRLITKGVVDPGASRLVLPHAIVKQLGLSTKGKVKVRYADGRTARRDAAKGVHVVIQGRDGVFTALVEPKRQTALIGAIVLEDLDFLVDCAHQRLVPRDPRYVVSEVE